MLSDDQIRDIARGEETTRYERKRSDGDKGQLRQAVTALANDLGGSGVSGLLIVGQERDGRAAGLQVDDERLQFLSSIFRDGSILPLPTVEIRAVDLDDGPVAAVVVPSSDYPPLRLERRAWVRIGTTTRLATDQDERILAERRRAADLPFDMRGVQGATLQDIDLRRFELEYLPAAVAPDVLLENHRPLQDQLRSLRMADRDDRPTAAGILTLGLDPRAWLPGAYVQALRIDGASLTENIADQREITGTVPDQIRVVDELFKVWNTTAIDLSGPVHREVAAYPEGALREIMRNALLHRSYEGSNTPVRIYWFADRVEIQNPGGPFGEVSPEALRTGQPGVTAYRNPALAEALKALGYVQRFGYGLVAVNRQMTGNGNPAAEFRVETNFVNVTLRRRL